MFALLRTGSVLAAITLTSALPSTAEAQWFGWGWDWGWGPGYYEPAGAWTSYYPGSYAYGGYGGGYGSYYAPGGCCAPACGCDPCCSPCGPCGSCGACGLRSCAGGNCAGGNCAYDAPANGAPIPDPNADMPPNRPRTNSPPRTRERLPTTLSVPLRPVPS